MHLHFHTNHDFGCSILLESGFTIWYVIRNSGYACSRKQH